MQLYQELQDSTDDTNYYLVTTHQERLTLLKAFTLRERLYGTIILPKTALKFKSNYVSIFYESSRFYFVSSKTFSV